MTMLQHLDDPQPVPAATPALREAVLARGSRLRQRRRARQIALPVTLTAAAVAAALVVGTRSQVQPAPVIPVAPTPTTSQAASLVPPGAYEALALRGTAIVAVDADGRERPVRDLAGSGLTPSAIQWSTVSSSGWLSAEDPRKGREGMELLDLQRAGSRPRRVSGFFDGRTWSPDGTRLATTMAGAGPQALGGRGLGPVVLDPATGAITEVDLQGGQLPGGYPDLIWTADGSGLLTTTDGDTGQDPAASTPRSWRVARFDGRPAPTDVPALWYPGIRYVVAGARAIHQGACSSWTDQCYPIGSNAGLGIPGMLDPQTMVVRDADGTESIWYQGEIAGTTMVDSSLTADGKAAWLLLTRKGRNDELLLARTDAGRRAAVVSTIPVATTDLPSIGTLAADDSMLVVSTVSNQNAKNPTWNAYLVPADGRPRIDLKGRFLGFVPVPVASAIAAAAAP